MGVVGVDCKIHVFHPAFCVELSEFEFDIRHLVFCSDRRRHLEFPFYWAAVSTVLLCFFAVATVDCPVIAADRRLPRRR